MTYVALLRGINVGGNNKVEMKLLKATFERLGLEQVKTYINSGNVIFQSQLSASNLVKKIEQAIASDFGFEVKVLLRDLDTLKKNIADLPPSWLNNSEMKCDVMFLWEEVDSPSVLKELPVKDGIDEVLYSPGAILWRIDRSKATRSGIAKIVGTKLYKQMTIRNCNTARKLLELMSNS